MGLDMYLKAELYLWGSDEDKKKEIQKMFPEIEQGDGFTNGVEIKFGVGYWRKANAIHQWFVDNCQGGNDDCNYHYVDPEQLKELKSICEEILNKSIIKKGKVKNGASYQNGEMKENYEDGEYIENPEIAESLLPTQQGFFFGGYDYDQWYVEDLKKTIKIIDYALSLPDKYDLYYRASW